MQIAHSNGAASAAVGAAAEAEEEEEDEEEEEEEAVSSTERFLPVMRVCWCMDSASESEVVRSMTRLFIL